MQIPGRYINKLLQVPSVHAEAHLPRHSHRDVPECFREVADGDKYRFRFRSRHLDMRPKSGAKSFCRIARCTSALNSKPLFFWYDYFSCPQLEKNHDFHKAVDSIPGYIGRCEFFFVLVPVIDNPSLCKVFTPSSWSERGWSLGSPASSLWAFRAVEELPDALRPNCIFPKQYVNPILKRSA